MKTDSEHQRLWWDAKAPREEQDLADEAINRALRWREIERHLKGVHSVLDIGAGTGAFSIPLARRGFSVTHLDFSPKMLEIAREKASGVDNMLFVEGNAVDLSRFQERSFDLVLNMDGAISFCGSEAERALAESCRVTGKRLIITVSHRACLLPVWTAGSLEVMGRILPAAYEMLECGRWDQEQFPENALLTADLTKGYLGAIKAFLPGELRRLLEQADMRVSRIGGFGSLANLCGHRAIERVLSAQGPHDAALLEEFLDLCERFDREILPEGPGTRQRAGLIAVAEPLDMGNVASGPC